jgi:hypothetical protein
VVRYATQIFYHCLSAESFRIEVQGSKKYIVTYDSNNRSAYQYDYSCTCESFKFGKRGTHCKHIDKVKDSGDHCKWDQFVDGLEPEEINGVKTCPRCGNSVVLERYAV